MLTQNRKLFFIVLVVIGSLFVACTPQEKYEILSFFFDGVPLPLDESAIVNDSNYISNKPLKPIIKKAEYSTHKPYIERKCESCHIKGSMSRLRYSQPSLCYQCHEDFNVVYSSLHGPVQAGYCTTCHNSHKTKNAYLLVENGQVLCLKCHSEVLTFESGIHSGIENANCIDCHNPHGGDNTAYLKNGTCINCHDGFSKMYNFVHGPVASGNCSMCHESHTSSKESLLLRTGQELCTFCHEQTQIINNEYHEGIDDIACIECHNAHGGQDRFLFN